MELLDHQIKCKINLCIICIKKIKYHPQCDGNSGKNYMPVINMRFRRSRQTKFFDSKHNFGIAQNNSTNGNTLHFKLEIHNMFRMQKKFDLIGETLPKEQTTR